jgi:hypothetical protein
MNRRKPGIRSNRETEQFTLSKRTFASFTQKAARLNVINVERWARWDRLSWVGAWPFVSKPTEDTRVSCLRGSRPWDLAAI